MYVFLHKSAAAQEPLPEILDEAHKGVGQFAIIVGDVGAVCSELAGRGVKLLSGPADRPWGMRMVTSPIRAVPAKPWVPSSRRAPSNPA